MKSFKPFIREFIILLFVAGILTLFLVCGDFIQIDIKPHFVSYLVLIFILLLILYPFKNIIVTAVAAIIDCVFKSKCEVTATFIEVHQIAASTFTDRITDAGSRTVETETRFIYLFNCKNKKIRLYSAKYFDVTQSKKYKVVYGKYSRIILSVLDY